MRRLVVALLAAALLAAGGCTRGGEEPPADPPGTLRVLAGSELKDVEPLAAQIRDATGVNLRFDYVGTLEGAERLAAGPPPGTDLAWFSSARYLNLLTTGGGRGRPLASTRIMLSPVVLGVKRSVAARFGWAGGAEVTWKDIAAKARSGQLRYGMTNPAASNSGFAALVGVAAALADTGDALRASDIDERGLTDFFKGQTLTAGSSGWLADAYVAGQARLEGIINYESVLLGLNASGRLREPLELIYPKDGIITADYPLLLLNQAKRGDYDKLVAYLRSAGVQRQLMTATARRPAVPEVAPDRRFPTRVLVELPFPASLEVVNQLLFAYLHRIRRPAHTIYALDVSGSMDGERIQALKQALVNLTGADTSISGRLAGFRARERVTMITFAGRVVDERDFTVDGAGPAAPGLAAIRDYVAGLRLHDGTAIFSAMRRAYRRAAEDARADRGSFTSIVLMTDGENNRGISADEFLAGIGALGDQARSVKTFAIQFGEASPAELDRIVQATAGARFDANQTSLAAAFKEIRGYQ
ncbi:MAG TPA: VWA domain-containing protein [Actinomycetes bacterium]|jgi:Ca-activated chloride channel family protein|nr:VWA domain-containing protein [Actinomycetes bacterium]